MNLLIKKTIFRPLIFIGLISMLGTFASQGQDIVGVWLTEKGESKIEIFQQDGKFFGRLVWAKNQSEKVQKTVGTMILKEFLRQENNTYKGNVFAPHLNKNFNGVITPKSENVIVVRGYLGLSLFGGSQTWTRVQNNNQ